MASLLPVKVFERCPPQCWERSRSPGRADRWVKRCDHIPEGVQEFRVVLNPPAREMDWEQWMSDYEAVEAARKETRNG